MGRFTFYNSRPRFLLLFLIPLLLAAGACHEEGQVQVSGFDLKGVESIDKARLKSVLATSESSSPVGRSGPSTA